MKAYGTCPTKAAVRLATLVEPWRRLSGHRSVNRDYVSLVGPVYDAQGTLLPRCEPLHVIDEGLATWSQIHGIERREDIHHGNVRAARRWVPGWEKTNLHFGDVVAVLDEALARRRLRPAIVNLDLMVGPREGLHKLGAVLSIVNRCDPPTLVVWNVIASRSYPRRIDLRDEFETMAHHSLVVESLRLGAWEGVGQLEYPGTGRRSKHVMRSLVFWRPPTARRVR